MGRPLLYGLAVECHISGRGSQASYFRVFCASQASPIWPGGGVSHFRARLSSLVFCSILFLSGLSYMAWRWSVTFPGAVLKLRILQYSVLLTPFLCGLAVECHISGRGSQAS